MQRPARPYRCLAEPAAAHAQLQGAGVTRYPRSHYLRGAIFATRKGDALDAVLIDVAGGIAIDEMFAGVFKPFSELGTASNDVEPVGVAFGKGGAIERGVGFTFTIMQRFEKFTQAATDRADGPGVDLEGLARRRIEQARGLVDHLGIDHVIDLPRRHPVALVTGGDKGAG